VRLWLTSVAAQKRTMNTCWECTDHCLGCTKALTFRQHTYECGGPTVGHLVIQRTYVRWRKCLRKCGSRERSNTVTWSQRETGIFQQRNRREMKTTLHTQLLGGVPCSIPNRTDEVPTGSEHWHISYNNYDRALYGSVTTALVLGQSECFLILNGDHREGLRACIESRDLSVSSLNRCLRYIREHKGSLNFRSDPII